MIYDIDQYNTDVVNYITTPAFLSYINDDSLKSLFNRFKNESVLRVGRRDLCKFMECDEEMVDHITDNIYFENFSSFEDSAYKVDVTMTIESDSNIIIAGVRLSNRNINKTNIWDRSYIYINSVYVEDISAFIDDNSATIVGALFNRAIDIFDHNGHFFTRC